MRQWFNQKIVLTIIMIIVTTILIIGATVAWFLVNKSTTIKNGEYQVGGVDGFDVKMAIVSDNLNGNGGSDSNMENIDGVIYYTMDEINPNNKEIDIDLSKLMNIEEGKLAPGSYGTIKFLIRANSKEKMNYILRITPNIVVVDGVPDTSNNDGISKEVLSDLVKNHIKFYAVKEENPANANNEYQQVIPYYDENANVAIEASGLTGSVSASDSGNTHFVTIYWYWPYEYTDIPGYGIADYSSTIYNPWRNIDGAITYEGKYSDNQYSSVNSKIEAYDWDDTMIGNYVTSLQFHFEVSSYQ